MNRKEEYRRPALHKAHRRRFLLNQRQIATLFSLGAVLGAIDHYGAKRLFAAVDAAAAELVILPPPVFSNKEGPLSAGLLA